MPNSISEFLLIAAFAAFLGFFIFGGFFAGSTKALVRRAQAEGRHRIVEIDGKQYHAIRKKELILRSRSGRARAVLVSVGRERDPDFVAGKHVMSTRWVKIRSFTRKGLSENERWVSPKGWVTEGEEEIEYHIPFK